MIPVRCKVVAGVALSKIAGETKMLLMKRSPGGYWCHVAGKVERDETGYQAIVREFDEETQIKVTRLYNGDYLEQFYEPSKNLVEIIPVFVVYCPPEQAVTLNEEHTEYKWCSLSEAKKLVPFANQKAVYDHVWQHFVESIPSELSRIKLDDV